VPPPAPISLTDAAYIENLVIQSAPSPVVSLADAAPYQCLARSLIDDPLTAPMLLMASLTPEQQAQLDAYLLAARPLCGLPV
jgi:hypothetical protein